MKTTAAIALGALLAATLPGGCGPSGGSAPAAGAEGDERASGPAGGGDPGRALASDGARPEAARDGDDRVAAAAAELVRRLEGQLKFADGVSEELKRSALALDDDRLDRQISAIDERLGLLRAWLDELRRAPPPDPEAARIDWDAAMDEVRAMCRRARERADEPGA